MQRTTDLTNRRLDRRRARTVSALIAAGALVFTACSADTPDAPATADGPDPSTSTDTSTGTETETDDTPRRSTEDSQRQAKVALRQFDGCDGFLDYVHTEGAERVGAYGFDDQQFWFRDGVPFEDEAMEDAEATGADAMEEADLDFEEPAEDGVVPASADEVADTSSGDGSDTFSGTNVQVEGVDEPDIVKTDGQRVLAITGNQLVYVDIDDEGRAGERRGSVALADEDNGAFVYGQELLMSGDRAFVVANVEGGVVRAQESAPVTTTVVDVDDSGDAETEFVDDPIPIDPIPTEPFPTEPFPRQRLPPAHRRHRGRSVRSGRTADRQHTLTVDGRYVSALARSERPPALSCRRRRPTSASSIRRVRAPKSEPPKRTASWSATRRSRTGFRPTPSPPATATPRNGSLVDCVGVHAPPAEFAGFDMLSVLTLPMDESLGSPADTTSVMASGDTVYSSQDRMYISTNEWVPPTLDDQERGIWEESYTTGIHRFSLPTGEAARYEASGTVDGHLLNQFSMHDQGRHVLRRHHHGHPVVE